MNPKETFLIAMDALRSNKLRSFLTLIGIAIGVFSIIAVMTAIGVLQSSIESGLTQLGTNTFQIQRLPSGINRGGNNQAFRNRKHITFEQASYVKETARLPVYVGIEVWNFGDIIRSAYDQTRPGVTVVGGDYAFFPNNSYNIIEGRSLTDDDVNFSRQVAVLGKDVSDKIFANRNPIGEMITIKGQKFTVVGMIEPKGQGMGGSNDNLVAIPITAWFKMFGTVNRDIHITVMAQSTELMQETQDEIFTNLRAIRKLEPGAENDFEMFSNESLIETFNEFTASFKIGAAVISFIALLAAGIGIMNIMLVSVTERTKEIGIRKAIGAQKNSILFQFLSEAVIICQIGGIVGILLGVAVGNLVAFLMDTPAIFPWLWATIGVVVCSIVGISFGSYPAYKAAQLDPIEALRYE